MSITKKTVEVCFSPKLYEHKLTKEDFVVVVVDIFRASTSICAAMAYGIKEVIPVRGLDEAQAFQGTDKVIACERDGQVQDFADIGNSPSDFLKEELKGKSIVFSTTNGTQAVNMAKDGDAVAVGAFICLEAIAQWAKNQHKNVVIFCAAWKNLFNLEDTLFAGAVADILLQDDLYTTVCDSTLAAIDLWQVAQGDLQGYLSKCSHRNRLKHLISDEDYAYTLTLDSTRIVPVLHGDKLISLSL